MKFLKFAIIIFAGVMILGCGDGNKENNKENSNNAPLEKVYKVGSENAYAPFSFVARDGKVSGYDVEVLRLLSSIDENLKFEFITAPWDALFIGLDSLRFDLLANQIIATPERIEKYTLNKEPYFVSVSQFVVNKKSEISKIDDIKGKKVGAVVGSAHTKILEQWSNKNEIEIVYYKDLNSVLIDIVNGRIDAHLGDPVNMKSIINEQGLDIRVIDGRLAQENVFFIMNKENQELANKLDNALKIAKENGSLKELSEKYFDDDRTK